MVAVKEKDNRELVKSQGNLPFLTDDQVDQLPAGTGAGISDKAEHNLIPLVSVMQFLSPQVEERDTRYIPGAKPGMIWLRNHPTHELLDGDQGFYWQQCFFSVDWIEWVPKELGGGLVARYADKNGPDCPDAVQDRKNKWVWHNGENEIVQNYTMAGFVMLPGEHQPFPYVIPFKGAGIAEAKRLITAMPRLLPNTSDKADAYHFAWHVVSTFKQNTQGKWYDLHVKKRMGLVPPLQYEAGKKLFEAFDSGAKRAEEEDTIIQPQSDDVM